MKIVLDTNILVRANPLVPAHGLSRELLTAVSQGPHRLLLSAPILQELVRVLEYPHLRKRWPLTDAQIAGYVEALADVAVWVDVSGDVPAVVSDPDDDPIIQTAVLGEADVLCSHDRAFHEQTVIQYCREHGLRIASDVELLNEIRARDNDQEGSV